MNHLVRTEADLDLEIVEAKMMSVPAKGILEDLIQDLTVGEELIRSIEVIEVKEAEITKESLLETEKEIEKEVEIATEMATDMKRNQEETQERRVLKIWARR